MAAILPQYFPYSDGWIIAPEVWNEDPSVKHGRTDLVVILINENTVGIQEEILVISFHT